MANHARPTSRAAVRFLTAPRNTTTAQTRDWALLGLHGTQALTGLGTLVLAVWAVFFSTLPEVLENQLRAEIVDARAELALTRSQNGALLETQRTIEEQSASAELGLALLTKQIGSLEDEKAALTQEVAELLVERDSYATDARERALAVLVEVARFQLDTYTAVATICAGYAEHRAWLDATRALPALRAEWEAQPFEQMYDESNPTWVRVQELERFTIPDFWFAIPHEPILNPAQGGDGAFLNELDVAVLNASSDPEASHAYLIDFLFSVTVTSQTVQPVTGRSFVNGLKAHKSLAAMRTPDREALELALDGFLASHPKMVDTQLNVTFVSEPTPDEIEQVGRAHLGLPAAFSEVFLSYLSSL